MRAMIFAAGLGTRLKPWTDHHPKALVPVGGVPMLERVILKLRDVGITEMVVNVHHFDWQIVDFLRKSDNFGCDIHISDERELLLDTGGGILAARRWLEPGGEPFVVHNADILTDFDLAGMIDAHTGHPDSRGEDAPHSQPTPLATLLVAPRQTSRYLLFDDEMRMRGWTNVTTGQVRPGALLNSREFSTGLPGCREFSKSLENSREFSTAEDQNREFSTAEDQNREFSTAGMGILRLLAFGGVHVLSPGIFELLAAYREPGVPFSITDFYIDSCATQLIRGYQAPAPYLWHDIGKPASLDAANQALAGGK